MRWVVRVAVGMGVFVTLSAVAPAQLSSDDLARLRERGEREGWTFSITPSEATARPLSELCGLVAPDRWWEAAPYDPCTPTRDLPPSFDWRNYNGQNLCTPIRNQDGCGSCWAFATVGPLECNIKIVDGVSVDLSEQWLVSCNRSGWGCGGGWWAHNYHGWTPDHCGGSGAVLESVFPYVASDAPCNCPYEHAYHIASWHYIGNGSSIPGIANMKQAIMEHGPITVGVYVDSAFAGYGGGIFNACVNGTINHGVVLVGWNDADGGYWIMRNSWGGGWGEDGYMRILYNCSEIGYAACYVYYPGAHGLEVTPATGLESTGDPGGPFNPNSQTYTLTNTGSNSISYRVMKSQPWISLDNVTGYLPSGDSATVTVTINSSANTLAAGTYSDTVHFDNMSTHVGDTTRPITLHVGVPHQVCGWNLDTDPGWTTQGQWAWGTPTGGSGDHGGPDATSGHTGTQVYGYNLNGGYTNDMPAYGLTTNAIDCTGLSQVTLRFWRWLGIERSLYDHANVQVSNDGSNWNTIWENPDTTIDDQAWVYQEFDIHTYADHQPAVYLRWTMGPTDVGWTYCGWNIDDVEIWALEPPTKGDMNCDGAVNAFDVDPFVLALTDPSGYQAQYPNCGVDHADCNDDGAVNSFDIDPFVDLLTGG
jgi:hypothetical protein